jgi:uncharacterized membrane protein YgdD (TMEM256/DUF423 family)
MARYAIAIGAVLGMLGVAMGAFGAHSLQETLQANGRVDTFKTAAQYHQLHAVLLICIGCLRLREDCRWLSIAAWMTLIGVIIFSGSLYALSLTNTAVLGAVAPIGGLCMMIGWLSLAPFGIRAARGSAKVEPKP